jgi:thiamine-monophosphate kinase
VPRPTEDELIAQFFAPLAGPGGLNLVDDAALLALREDEELVLTTDMLIGGVHFFPDDLPDAIAKKTLRVNLSDLAAKGATPRGFLLNLGLPRGWTADWLAAFAKGLGEDATQFNCPLLGGDTVKSPGALTLSITALGAVPRGKMVPRPGVVAGDLLYVSGTIGDAALGLRLRKNEDADHDWIATLDRQARDVLRGRYLLPQPRLGLAPLLRAHARTAMDVSDGLAGDLAKMLRLTGLTAAIAIGDIPLSSAARQALTRAPELIGPILSGGDDYEILCAVPVARSAAFEAAAKAGDQTVTQIGRARPGEGAPIFRDRRGPVVLAATSYQHF